MTHMNSSSVPRAFNGLVVLVCLPVLFCGCSEQNRSSGNRRVEFKTTQVNPEIQCDRPPSATTLYSMADILAAQGRDMQCEFVLRQCIQQYPQFKPAYNSLGELQMRQGRVHEAARTLVQAIEIDPRDPVLLNNLGICFLVCREYETSLSYFAKAAGIVPESGKYRANMATCLGLLGRDDESLALLQQILSDSTAQSNVEILRKAREGKSGAGGDDCT